MIEKDFRDAMKSTLMRRAIATGLLALLVSLLVVASPLQIFTDKSTYSPEEIVTVTVKGKPNTTYGLEIRDPEGDIIVKEVDTGPDGTGIFRFTLPKEARLGKYTVYVSGGGETASTSFTVVAPAAPAPATLPPSAEAPSVDAAATLRNAKGRFQLLLYVLRSLNASLGLLRLESVLAEVWAAVDSVNSTLQRADAALAARNYNSANSLASSAYRDAGQLISKAFDLTVSALRGHASRVRNATSDELVLSLLNVVEALLSEVSPTYVDPSLRAVNRSTYILLAASKLVNATRLEAETKELSGRLEALQKMLSEAQSKLKELEESLIALQSTNEQLSAQLSDAQSALAAARKEIERLEAENEQLRVRNAELERKQAAGLSPEVHLITMLIALGSAAGLAAGYLIGAKKSK